MKTTKSLALALFLTCAAASPVGAYNEGDVLLEIRTRSPYTLADGFDLWHHVGSEHANLTGWSAIYKVIPFTGPGRFLVPVPNQILFHHEQTVSVWDGVPRLHSEEGRGFADIFEHDAELGEFVPLRSGNFLVAERWSTGEAGANLIEFNFAGRVRKYPLPTLRDPTHNRILGATYFELLGDRCTVLYTLGYDDPAGSRVRRVNICTGKAETDFAMLLPGSYAGAIRQLRSGDVLVANGSAVLRFTRDGSPVRAYDIPGVTHLALAPDSGGFWAAGIHAGEARLHWIDLSETHSSVVRLGNRQRQTVQVPLDVSDLVVVGEWRAALATGRARAVRSR